LSWEDEDPRIQVFIDRVKDHFSNHEKFADGLQIGK